MQDRFEHLKKTFEFLQIFVKKELYRQHLVEAVAGYHNYTLNPLVELLGMAYRPYKYDYKSRYISRDFPPDVITKLETLFCIVDIDDLREKQQLAELLFAQTLTSVEMLIATPDLIHPQ